MNWLLGGIVLYVVCQLAIGVAVASRQKTENDYLLAGRSLGYPLAIFSIFATWFGAETCIGSAGAIYEDGISGGTADPFGYGLCLLLMGLVFAAPLRRRGYMTVADLYRERYSPGVERLAVLLMVPGSLLWAAAQIRAFGQVLTTASELELELTITIAAGVVVAYTVFGGLLADAWTDVVQGVALILGLVVVTAVVLSSGAASFEDLDPARLAPFGGPETTALDVLEAWAVPVMGSVVAQELIARVLAARSVRIARRATLIATGVYLTVGLLPVALGLLGPMLVPELRDSELLLPMIARRYLPDVLYALFAGALVSAILSTVDSALLVSASLTSHNLVLSLRPKLSERSKVAIARAGVVVFGIIAYVVALHAQGVYELVKDASAFGSAGLFVCLVLGLFTSFGRAPSAAAALVTGTVVWLLLSYVLPVRAPYLASLLAAALAYVAFAALGSRGASARNEQHMDATAGDELGAEQERRPVA